MKKSKILFALMPLATASISLPAVLLTGCDNTKTYTISYGTTPTGLTYTSQPTSVKEKTAVSITYTIETNYSIDTSNCTVTCGGTDITSNCTFNSTTTTIPSDYVTGNLVVKLATKTNTPTVESYSVLYNTPTGLTWNTAVSSVTKGESLYMEYSLQTNYFINTDACYITVNGNPVTSQITWKKGKISIPADLLTGDVVIYLQLSYSTTYDVKYTGSSSDITWDSQPSTCKSGTNFEVDYKLTSGKAISTSSTITCGENEENDISYYCTFANGTVVVPGEKITDELHLNLITVDESTLPQQKIVTEEGGSHSTKKSDAGNTVYTLAADSSNNGTMNITLSGVWTNCALKIASAGTYNITLADGFKLSNAAFEETTAVNGDAPISITKKATNAIVNIIIPADAEASINDLRTGTVNDDSDDFVIRHNGVDSTTELPCGGQLNFIGTSAGGGVLNINNRNANTGWDVKAIQTKCDMTISGGVTINAFAKDTCIQCGGLLTIDNANVIADSYTDDGIKTKFLDPDEDLAVAGTYGNNKRDIVIKGDSNIKVFSDKTGINAAHDFITAADNNGTPNITVYTNTKAKNINDKTVTGTTDITEQNMFIEVPSSYSTYCGENYFWTIDFYADTGSGESTSTEYMTLKKIATTGGQGQSSSTNYFFKCDRPLDADAAYFKINLYAKDQYGAETMTPTASSGYITITSPTTADKKDCVAVTSISDSIATSKTYFDRNYKATEKGESTEEIDTTVSSKGIKAKNNISLPAGDITIDSVDTCISASYGDIYCTSTSAGSISLGQGTIQLSGAAITGYSAEGDGVKAYGQLDISAGSLNVTNSVEALEAPIINISGGKTVLKANDDGINASTSGKYVTSGLSVNMSGGILDIEASGGDDMDCIDSNNTLTITGGLLVARVPANGGSMTLDWETDNVSVTGTATVVLLGKTEADGNMGPEPEPTSRTISTTGTDYTSSIKTATACSVGDHKITYYNSAYASANYTYNNSIQVNSSTVRVWSCTGKVTIA